MACISWVLRQSVWAGIVAMLLVGALATEAHAQLGSPSTKGRSAPSSNASRDGGHHDRGYPLQHSHHDLSSISQLILKLTQELRSLLDSGDHGHGFVDLDVLRKLAQIREAARARRQMQMAQVMEQVVDEMAQEEAEATKAGKSPGPQQIEQAVDKAEKKIQTHWQAVTLPDPGAPTGGNPPPGAVPPTKPAVDEDAAIDQKAKKFVDKLMSNSLQHIDDPEHPNNPFVQNSSDPKKAIEGMKLGLENMVKMQKAFGPTHEAYERRLREACEPIIERFEKREKDGTAWLESGIRLIQTSPATAAQRAESEAREKWRKENDRLQSDLAKDDKALRRAERILERNQDSSNRDRYDDALKARQKTVESLKNHQQSKPRSTS